MSMTGRARRRWAWIAAPVLACLLQGLPAAAVPPGSASAEQALTLCNQADDLAGEAKDDILARSRALAEHAIEADAHDARAHFARFCAIGKQMEQTGVGLGQLFALRRLRAALETALELAPHDADALAAKGAMLLRLPRLLGGDVKEAERLLRAAVEADPTNNEARCYLSRALSARGADAEARALHASC